MGKVSNSTARAIKLPSTSVILDSLFLSRKSRGSLTLKHHGEC